ncbi:hypothetical protein EV126DRAFT_80204 [Verticillium dahliae]|nr:hypothetical protein EV126DRAFT_80204 [Verticillium dahliae]
MQRSSGRRRRARSSGISGLLGVEAACARIDEPRGGLHCYCHCRHCLSRRSSTCCSRHDSCGNHARAGSENLRNGQSDVKVDRRRRGSKKSRSDGGGRATSATTKMNDKKGPTQVSCLALGFEDVCLAVGNCNCNCNCNCTCTSTASTLTSFCLASMHQIRPCIAPPPSAAPSAPAAPLLH